jgi:hypothetical protein
MSIQIYYGANNMIIAGEYVDCKIAKEVEDIVKVSLIGSRMRELSQINRI